MTTQPTAEAVHQYQALLIGTFNHPDESIAHYWQHDLGVRKQQYERSIRLPHEKRTILEDRQALEAEHLLSTVDALIADATADQLRRVIDGMTNAW